MDPRRGLTGLPLRQRSNRLRRSCRAAHRAADPGSDHTPPPDLKTPTRSCRSGGSAVFSGESPHNDSDLQQDIIWDATSPSANRLSKRGRPPPAGVNISELVSRIAPERGRPEVTEPTLQQWIGDSATIPCTPDVQVPRPKKKSQRSSGVDELLKLAKQFDFNMFRQDEEEVEDMHQQSLELLSEDILDFENNDQDDFSPLRHRGCEPAGTDAHVLLDQHTENDLDFLFDGPTQRVSGSLSQVSSAQTSQVKPALVLSSKEASGKSAAVSTTNSHGRAAHDEFEDDWENDDLLIDSLVLEMTQNPQFTGPMHSSTQKPTCGGVDQSAVCTVDKGKETQRTTFKLESNPNFSVRIQTWTNSKPAGDDTRSRFSGFPAQSQRLRQTSNSEAQKSWFDQRTSDFSSSASNAALTTTTQSFAKKPAALSSLVEPAGVSDVLDEDLDAFFSSEPVWDDPSDDNLLCEMCEDLENQIQSSDNVSAKQTLTSNQRAALQPSNRTWDNRSHQPANQQPVLQKQTGRSLAAVSSSNVTAGVQVNVVQDSFRFAQTNPRTMASSQVRSAAAAPLRNANKEQFTFKKPNNPVSTATNKVVGKCSAAEIELKKLRAMERRRQRLQDVTSQLQV